MVAYGLFCWKLRPGIAGVGGEELWPILGSYGEFHGKEEALSGPGTFGGGAMGYQFTTPVGEEGISGGKDQESVLRRSGGVDGEPRAISPAWERICNAGASIYGERTPFGADSTLLHSKYKVTLESGYCGSVIISG